MARWAEGKFVCVGLDSWYFSLPACVRKGKTFEQDSQAVVDFNRQIILHTRDLVCAFKPNLAFYLGFGPAGIRVLAQTVEIIKSSAPEVPVILDAKFADIGSTNEGYSLCSFDYMQADAVTVNPYFASEAMQPFLDRTEKEVIVVCRTSNPGAARFQDLIQQDGRPLYQHVAEDVAKVWNRNGNCSVVVGATVPEQLGAVRGIVGDMPILIPGIGAQGGDLVGTVKNGRDSAGRGMIINSSRGIIFASKDDDYPEAARIATQKLDGEIRALLAA